MQILKEKIVRYETDGSIVKGYDAGELIRCKDCQYYSPFTETTVSWCPVTGLKGLPEEAYCYVAEKKETK